MVAGWQGAAGGDEAQAAVLDLQAPAVEPDEAVATGRGMRAVSRPRRLRSLGSAFRWTLFDVTLTGDDAGRAGDGIPIDFGAPTPTNAIVLGLGASDGAELFGWLDPASGNNPVSYAMTPAVAVSAALDAQGGGLSADDGGPVKTIALLASRAEPALDAEDDAAPDADARGLSWPADRAAVNQGAGASDLGAFERRGGDDVGAADDAASAVEHAAVEGAAGAGVLAEDEAAEGRRSAATAVAGQTAGVSHAVASAHGTLTP